MNITDLKSSLEYLFKAQVTPFIWGHAGVGKSTIVKQYANDKGYKFFPFYLGTQSDLGDILGLASFVKDKNGSEIATTFATPLWLKEMIEYCENNPKSGAIIFLDEFNRARRDVLNGMFSLALDKTFHTIVLPKNCHVVAAGNPPTDEYITTNVDETALMARFAHIKLEPTFNEWVAYAKANTFEPTLISFLQDQPELLEEPRSDYQLPVKCDRRAYERINRLFSVNTPMNLLEQLMAGIIGVERLVAYNLHLTRSDKPLSWEQVVNGNKLGVIREWSNPKDIKSSLLSVTCNNIVDAFKNIKELTETQADNLTVFLETAPREVSYVLITKLLNSNYNVFKSYTSSPIYESRIMIIAKEAKGMKP